VSSAAEQQQYLHHLLCLQQFVSNHCQSMHSTVVRPDCQVRGCEEGAEERENESNNSKPNQNHWGAAMHTAAGREGSIAINRKQHSTLH
jgi:hypothetical protein